jgi:hypothetical protein
MLNPSKATLMGQYQIGPAGGVASWLGWITGSKERLSRPPTSRLFRFHGHRAMPGKAVQEAFLQLRL